MDSNKVNVTEPRELPPVLKSFLRCQCGDEIFDYLSLKSLHALSQTCDVIQQEVGEYFQYYYRFAEKICGADGVDMVYTDNEGAINQRIQTSSFNKFINYLSIYYEREGPLQYIKAHSNEFESINHIYLVCLEINCDKVQYLREILSKIEYVQINQCTLQGDFYRVFLRLCENLKRINVHDDLGNILTHNENVWLLQRYPLLEHVHLIPRQAFKMTELRPFLENNRNIRHFSTSSNFLWENRKELLQSSVRLEILEIEMWHKYFFFRHCGAPDKMSFRSLCRLLNQLHQIGFYKRLHLYVKHIDQECADELLTLHALEKLQIKHLEKIYSLPRLSNLKALDLPRGVIASNLNELAKGLTSLDELYIRNITGCDILPFVQYSAKLRRIHADFNDGIPDLVHMDNERSKLNAARKVKMYVNDNIFLTIKWSDQGRHTNLSFVEVKRIGSHYNKPHIEPISRQCSTM